MSEVNAQAIQRAVLSIVTRGPDRVIVSSDGEATSCRRARDEHGVLPDVILIRNDGWSLGAPFGLLAEAHALWLGDWVGFMVRPESKMRPMSEVQGHDDIVAAMIRVAREALEVHDA